MVIPSICGGVALLFASLRPSATSVRPRSTLRFSGIQEAGGSTTNEVRHKNPISSRNTVPPAPPLAFERHCSIAKMVCLVGFLLTLAFMCTLPVLTPQNWPLQEKWWTRRGFGWNTPGAPARAGGRFRHGKCQGTAFL